MMAPIPPAAVDRLAKVAGLLGSSHDGERSAAAYRATEILRELGLTWRELVERACAEPPQARIEPPEEEGSDLPMHWRLAAHACLRAAWALSDWECQFLQQIVTKPRISIRQRAILAELYAKVTEAAE